MGGMTDLARLLPHVAAFPHALGCGIIVRSKERIDGRLHGRLAAFIDGYEHTLSRFRVDSTVARLAQGGRTPSGGGSHGDAATGMSAADGMSATFPAWTYGLFELTDRLVRATDGAIDPCVGETMVRLGYGVELGRAFRGEVPPAEPAASTGAGRTGDAQPADGGSEAARAARSRSWDELDAETAERPRWDRDVRWGTDGMPARGGIERTEPGNDDDHTASRTGAADACGEAGTAGKAGMADMADTADTAGEHTGGTDGTASTAGMADIAGEHSADGMASTAGMTGMAGEHSAGGKDSKAAPTAADTVMLTVCRPVLLDFGSCGKGYLVDLLADMLRSAGLHGPLVIDAGGDLRIEGLEDAPLRIGLEDPADPASAVGVAQVGSGSLCASSPSRRHWAGAHHLINALDGRPANDVAASWTFVRHQATLPANGSVGRPDATETGFPPQHGTQAARATRVTELVRRFPTAVADGLATALFVADPGVLRDAFPYDCAILDADRTARMSAGFPGTLFVHRLR